jgi:acyl-CoA thioesterase-1
VQGLDYEVINAGVSGDTSAGGLERLEWALQGNVKILIVALGGNDALRGLPAAAWRPTCRRSSNALARARFASSSPEWRRRRTTGETTSSPS